MSVERKALEEIMELKGREVEFDPHPNRLKNAEGYADALSKCQKIASDALLNPKPCVIDGGANEYIRSVCSKCGWESRQGSDHEALLIHHMSIEHPYSVIPVDSPSSKATQEKIAAAAAYRCVFCTFASPTAEMLADHLKTVHREEVAGEQRIVGRKMVIEEDRESLVPAYTEREISKAVQKGFWRWYRSQCQDNSDSAIIASFIYSPLHYCIIQSLRRKKGE